MPTWKVGEGSVPRTGDTLLTDDELILCDAIFRHWDSPRALAALDFVSNTNLPYAPKVTGDDLVALLESMHRRGIIKQKDRNSRFGPAISLSTVGGALWERERRPIWENYVTSHFGDERATAIALRKEVAEAELRASIDANLFDIRGMPEIAIDDDAQILPWKGARVFVLTFRRVECLQASNHRAYESRRIWWSSVPDLLRSHRAMKPLPGFPIPPPLLFSGS